MVTAGLDLHKRYITGCALDASGTVLSEHRRLEPSLDALGRWLGGLVQPVQVVMEATLYWHWLERHLTERGFHVLVAHPYQVKLIWQARTKTDPIDARKLAEYARPTCCRRSGFRIQEPVHCGSCSAVGCFASAFDYPDNRPLALGVARRGFMNPKIPSRGLTGLQLATCYGRRGGRSLCSRPPLESA